MTHVDRDAGLPGLARLQGDRLSRVTTPGVRGTLLGALLRLWNPLMRRLIDSPVHWPLSSWFAVLAWTGRKTGGRYSTPVSYLREGGTAYVTTGDRWWRNLTGGPPVAMRIAGRWHEGTAAPLTDPAECRAEHERLFREHSWFRRLAGIPNGPEGGPDPAAVDRAVTAGRVLVRIELERVTTGLARRVVQDPAAPEPDILRLTR
jgi:hypothetical protein